MSEALQALQSLLAIPLFKLGATVLTVRAPVVIVVCLLVAHVVSRSLERLALKALNAVDRHDPDTEHNVHRLIRYPILTIGLITGLTLAGARLELVRDFFNLPLLDIGGTPISPITVLVFVLLVFASWWASRWAQQATAQALRMRGMTDEGTLRATQRLVHYAVMLVGVGVALETIGINLSMLFTAGAVFAVGFAFALQNIAENFVSGVILLVERAIKPGDVLEVDGELVRVRHMNIRSTVVRTKDDEDLIVPNAELVKGVVKNYSHDDELHRVRCEVGVTYDSDMRQVHDVLLAVGHAVDWRTQDFQPRVLMRSFGDSAVIWEVSVWAFKPWEKPQQMSDLHQAVWFALKDAGIVIAFPQLDVHLDAEVVARMSGARRDA